MASSPNPQKVVMIGHSFVKGMIQAAKEKVIHQNGGFTRSLHQNRYVTCLPPDVQIYMVCDCLNNMPALIREIGSADLAVIVLGTNDIVSDPLGLDKLLEGLLKIGIMLVASKTVRYIAYVEMFHCFGPNGFCTQPKNSEW